MSCQGFCDHVVHQKCISINKELVKAISDSPNLHWMCDECAKLLKMVRFRNAVTSLGSTINELTHSQEVANAELKKELAKHSEQIAQLSRSVAASVTPLSAPNFRRAPKRRRTEDDSRYPKALLGGTRPMDGVNITIVPKPVTLFWIYLSRLHPSVKPDAVEKITKAGLQCETVKAIPLVRRGVDLNSLNFISYKVGVDPKHRSAALNPATWPEGILFREFEDARSTNYWTPDPSTPSIVVTPYTDETPAPASATMDEDC